MPFLVRWACCLLDAWLEPVVKKVEEYGGVTVAWAMVIVMAVLVFGGY